MRRQDLDREPRISRPVDLSHPNGADRCEDLVGAESSSCRDRHLHITGSPDASRSPDVLDHAEVGLGLLPRLDGDSAAVRADVEVARRGHFPGCASQGKGQ